METKEQTIEKSEEIIQNIDLYEMYSKMIEEMGNEELDQHWCMFFANNIVREINEKIKEIK